MTVLAEKGVLSGNRLRAGTLTLILLQDKCLKVSQWGMEFWKLGDAGV